ncbi:MAG: hypothetical protein KDJ87_11270 [Rhizobiaceae bacterium]|nr:hypothetical protein [Rhizobiaceae bacterium]
MVNSGDLFVCLVAGLAIPLAIVDGLKAFGGVAMPKQPQGLHFERRPGIWLLAVIAGPGLFAERMLDEARRGRLTSADAVNAFVITLGWAAIYGFILLSLVRAMSALP